MVESRLVPLNSYPACGSEADIPPSGSERSLDPAVGTLLNFPIGKRLCRFNRGEVHFLGHKIMDEMSFLIDRAFSRPTFP